MKAKEYIAQASQPSTELNWKYIMFSLFGVALGVLGNTLVRKQQEKEIIASITKEIDDLKQLQAKNALTAEGQQQLHVLTKQREIIGKIGSRKIS